MPFDWTTCWLDILDVVDYGFTVSLDMENHFEYYFIRLRLLMSMSR